MPQVTETATALFCDRGGGEFRDARLGSCSFWGRFLTKRQLPEGTPSGWIRARGHWEEVARYSYYIAFMLWKARKSHLKYHEEFSLIKWCLPSGLLIMEAKAFSLSTGGHCSTEEETCFKRTFQKIMNVCRYEEELRRGGGAESEDSRAPVIHYWSGMLSPPSAVSVTTLYSPAKVSANLYPGRLCSLGYVLNVSFSSILIFLEYLNWFFFFFHVLQYVWDFSEQNI